MKKLRLVVNSLKDRWTLWKGKRSKTYTSFWLEESFSVKTGVRRRALELIETGNILGAVRLLYKRGYGKREIRHFLQIEMNIPWHSTVPLDEWNPELADAQQTMIVKRIQAAAQVMTKLRERIKKERNKREDAND